METVIAIPKTLAACCDALYNTKQKRLELQKEVDALAAQETALKDHLINNLPKDDATGVQGLVARATIAVKEVPQVTDWDKVYAYVKRRGAFELLQKRLSDAAVKDRWSNKKEIPGVEHFHLVTVSLNKI